MKKIIITAIVIVILAISAFLINASIRKHYENSGDFRILSISPAGNLSLSEFPATLNLVVKTGGENSEAVCYYSNTKEIKWIKFHETNNIMHIQSFLFPFWGEKSVNIKCENNNNETIESLAKFSLNQ